MAFAHELVRRMERVSALDKVAKPAAALVGKAVQPRVVRNLLSGTYLGHPAHPMLTDVPIGAWSMSALLDLVGGEQTERAADLLVGAGILSAIPTAATGLNDWSDTIGAERRLGAVHASANVVALTLYAASLLARRRGARGAGKVFGYAGFGVLLAGAYLGGHLSFAKAVNVNTTSHEHRPHDWTTVLAEAELAQDQPRKVSVGEASVLLVRHDQQVHALANTCSHAGGPLDEGQLTDGCIICPWHGSIFRLTDGHIVRGPASIPQPAYQTRIRNGKIEIRALS